MNNETLEHLKSRGLNPELYYASDLSFCDETKDVYFYLWNLSGELVGYQKYNYTYEKRDPSVKPSLQKYFTYLSKYDEKVSKFGIWGLSLLNPNRRVVFLVEGVFDAVKLHNLGLNALALMACDPKPLKSWLSSLGYELVSVCEGDKAGKKLAKLSTHKERTVYLEDGHDLGDMSQESVKELFFEYL